MFYRVIFTDSNCAWLEKEIVNTNSSPSKFLACLAETAKAKATSISSLHTKGNILKTYLRFLVRPYHGAGADPENRSCRGHRDQRAISRGIWSKTGALCQSWGGHGPSGPPTGSAPVGRYPVIPCLLAVVAIQVLYLQSSSFILPMDMFNILNAIPAKSSMYRVCLVLCVVLKEKHH